MMTSQNEDSSSRHEDLVSEASSQPSSANPFAQASNITVSVPESVEVKLVDASVLSDYEIWSLLTSVMGSAVVGFLVAYFQSTEVTKGIYAAVTFVFALIMLLAGGMAYAKRRSLTKNTKKLKFSVGQQIK